MKTDKMTFYVTKTNREGLEKLVEEQYKGRRVLSVIINDAIREYLRKISRRRE